MLLLISQRVEEAVALALDDALGSLRGWMVDKVVYSLVGAAFTWLGLALLVVPAAGGLGILRAALLTVIVYVLVQRPYLHSILGKPIKVGGQGL